MKKLVLMMMAVVFSLASFAQQGGQRREFSPESMATRRADQVKEAAQLNDEQYKKVYCWADIDRNGHFSIVWVNLRKTRFHCHIAWNRKVLPTCHQQRGNYYSG